MLPITKLRIATRKSQLAMWQAEYVRDRLMAAHEGLEVELVPLSTKGDKILDTPLAKIGGKVRFEDHGARGRLTLERQLELLRNIDCDYAQGYLIGLPNQPPLLV